MRICNNTIDKLKKGIVLVGLVGVLGISSGCGTAFMMSAPYEKDPRRASALYSLGNAINEEENAKTIAEAIKQSKQQPQDNPSKKDENENFIFAFTDVIDDNPKNGRYSLNEFKGLGKTVWEGSETIGFCIYHVSKRGNLRFVLKKVEKGKEFATVEEGKVVVKVEPDKEIVIRDVTDYDSGKGRTRIRDPPYPLSNGEYVAEWYINGALVGKTRVDLR